jgi:hypothetical protein
MEETKPLEVVKPLENPMLLCNIVTFEYEGATPEIPRNLHEVADSMGVTTEVAKSHLEATGKIPNAEEPKLYFYYAPFLFDLRDVEFVGSHYYQNTEEIPYARVKFKTGEYFSLDIEFKMFCELWLSAKHGSTIYNAFEKNVNNDEQGK